MSETQLNALRDRLLGIPATDIDTPEIPVPTLLQEANDLLTLLRDTNVWSKVAAVGIAPSAREDLDQAIGACRAAQSLWTVARDRQKSDAQKKREQRGEALRADLLAAARFNLRDDRVALATLSAIAQGQGVADLTQDLSDLGTLIEQRKSAFERDSTFDAAKRVEEARALSSELAAGTSGERLATDQAAAVDLRDRAYTHLDDLVSSLREAGRYAFRTDEKVRSRFASAYLRRKRKRITTDTIVAPVPSEE